jgi:hypothetical protein
MPTALRKILSPRFFRQSTERLAANPFGRLAARPFGRLVRQFLARTVSGSQASADSDLDLGIGGLLGLLATPGAFTCFLLLDKYSTFLNWYRGRRHIDIYLVSLSDKYLFIALAMAVTGIVTVLKWDKILPDSQDYLNLAPLPVHRRTILLANASAIAIAVMVFAIDVNAVPAFLFPLFVSTSGEIGMADFLRFAGVHLTCVLMASFFSICAVFALLGTFAAVLPRGAFRAISSWLRGIVLLGLITLLLTGFAGPALVAHLEQAPGSPVRLLPSLWFLGLYQSLQLRGGAVMADLAHSALVGTPAVFLLMLVSYAGSYRRRFAGVLEGERRPSEQHLTRWLLALLDLFAPRAAGFPRACHRFAVRALLRSEPHRLALSVGLGLGWLMASQGSPEAAPLTAGYLLILGTRLAFELPAGVPANWIFRAVLDPRANETLPAARRIMLAFHAPLVLLPAFALAWWHAGPGVAAIHTLYVLALSLCLIEIQLAGYRKIPLTCPMPGFQGSFLMLCFLQFLGFAVFTRAGAATEQWMFGRPLRFLTLPVLMFAAWLWNRSRIRQARADGEWEEGLTFENEPLRTVERLNLSESD